MRLRHALVAVCVLLPWAGACGHPASHPPGRSVGVPSQAGSPDLRFALRTVATILATLPRYPGSTLANSHKLLPLGIGGGGTVGRGQVWSSPAAPSLVGRWLVRHLDADGYHLVGSYAYTPGLFPPGLFFTASPPRGLVAEHLAITLVPGDGNATLVRYLVAVQYAVCATSPSASAASVPLVPCQYA